MKKLEILNIRRGFATNSSSSHSIIYRNYRHDSDCNAGEFGWQNFVAVSKEMKELYLFLTIIENLSANFCQYEDDGKDAQKRKDYMNRAVKVANKLLGSKIEVEANDYGGIKDCYIDHQSVYDLPVQFNDDTKLDKTFLKDLKDFFMQDNLAILGGNDNERDDSSPIGFKLPIGRDCYHAKTTARKDTINDYWTVFNRNNGNKVRFRFVDDCKKIPQPTKSFVPELLDIKITEVCQFADSKEENACTKYCYQNSKVNGKHVKFEDIISIAYSLSKLKVFEVALGGGEPTNHPRFLDILRQFRKNGIVPNFTTRNKNFFIGKKYNDEIFKLIGGVAYSIRNADEIIEINDILENNLYVGVKDYYNNLFFNVQLVMGTVTKEEFEKIIKTLNSTKHIRGITLLGYKKTGRGLNFYQNFINYDWWLEVLNINKTGYFNISVDTVIASQYEDKLKKYKISDLLYHTTEGKFSGYIDSLNGTFAPSSFADQSETIDLTEDENHWTKDLDSKIIKYYERF